MISQTVNNKRYSPVSRNICITQCNSQKKRYRVPGDCRFGIYSNIHISLYQKQKIRDETSISDSNMQSRTTA